MVKNSNQKCLVSASVLSCRTWPWSGLIGLMRSAFKPLCRPSSYIVRRNSVPNPSLSTMVRTDVGYNNDSHFHLHADISTMATPSTISTMIVTRNKALLVFLPSCLMVALCRIFLYILDRII